MEGGRTHRVEWWAYCTAGAIGPADTLCTAVAALRLGVLLSHRDCPASSLPTALTRMAGKLCDDAGAMGPGAHGHLREGCSTG